MVRTGILRIFPVKRCLCRAGNSQSLQVVRSFHVTVVWGSFCGEGSVDVDKM